MKRLAPLLVFLFACQSPAPTPSPSPSFIVTPEPSTIPLVLPSPTPTPHPSVSPSAKPAPSPSPTIQSQHIDVPLGTDLVKLLTGAKANQSFRLAKGTYEVKGSAVVTASNVRLDLNGSTLHWYPAAGSSSSIGVRAPHFEIFNGRISRAVTFIHSYADSLYIHDLTTDSITYGTPAPGPSGSPRPAGQLEGVSQLYTSDNKMATNNWIDRVRTGYFGTVGVYWSGDHMKITNSQFTGSYGEYNLRQEITSETPSHLPTGALISNVECWNKPNQPQKYGKACIGIRMGGETTIENSKLHGYIQVGQSGATGLGTNVPNLVVKNTTFDDDRDPQLSLGQGVTALVEGNTFVRFHTATAPIAVVSGVKTVQATLKNNIVLSTDPKVKSHGLYGTANNPQVVETNTIFK